MEEVRQPEREFKGMRYWTEEVMRDDNKREPWPVSGMESREGKGQEMQ